MSAARKSTRQQNTAQSSRSKAPAGMLGKLRDSLRRFGFRYTFSRLSDKRNRDCFLKAFAGQVLFSEEELAAQRELRFPQAHTFSIAVPLYNTPERFLREMIDSVLAQTYALWELCLADGSNAQHGEVERICREYAEKDSRVRYRKLEKNLGISGNSNAALEMASGDYIGLLDHDDILHPAALYEVMRTVCALGADFLYTDEAVFLSPDKSRLISVFFKSDFAPDTLLAINYTCHFTVFRRTLLDEVGLFDPACDGAQDHDLVLRLTEKAKRIAHIPEVLYYWRSHPNSVAQSVEAKPYASAAGVFTLEKCLRRRGLAGSAETLRPGQAPYRIRYEIIGTPKVSILIPNYEHQAELKTCLDSIFEKTSYPDYEIVIVENNSRSQALFAYYEALKQQHANVCVVTWSGDFNYAAVNNFGAQHCTGEYLLLLNNDTQIITPDWIQEMLMFAQRPDVGAVGAKLYYRSGRIQHGGIGLGSDGAAETLFSGVDRHQQAYMGRLLYAQDLSAVTGACMLLRREVWEQMHGLEEKLAVAYNDVDLCMRLRQAGYLVVWTPFAELYHEESKSRGYEDTPAKRARLQAERSFFHERWEKELEAGDPYFSPNLKASGAFVPPKSMCLRRDARAVR